MEIEINEELRAYIDPLTEDEYAALEGSILAEGCRDPLVLWGNVLVDGHNRYGICKKHGIGFQTVQNAAFRSMDDVRLWMIDNHLGRRSISDYQRGVLALRKKEILQARAQEASATERGEPQDAAAAQAPAPTGAAPLATRDAVAKAARLSPGTVGLIEKIQKTAAPELVSAVKSGVVSISAAAAVASLPPMEQAAAVAGGKEELRRAARQVREKKSRLRPHTGEPAGGAVQPPDAVPAPESGDVAELQRLVGALRAENAELKRRVNHLTIALKEARGGKGATPSGEA